MSANLDILPLRSLVSVADCGGFQKAASALHLSQGAVSQHVRRLESAVGTRLVERHGRGSRFTEDGHRLLVSARSILALHDETLSSFRAPAVRTITVGCTEHAATQLLPLLTTALEISAPQFQFKFRVDRGIRLREGIEDGNVDLALLFSADESLAVPVGDLHLAWYASPGWRMPRVPEPVPVVAFDSPCALRNRALQTLAEHGIPAVVGAEATQLAGVHAAVASGLGVALLATLGETPSGLVACADLPAPRPLQLYVCSRDDLPPSLAQLAASAVGELLRPVTHVPDLVVAS